eukprot:14138627-Alexandrium_andersonii.AAC.1
MASFFVQSIVVSTDRDFTAPIATHVPVRVRFSALKALGQKRVLVVPQPLVSDEQSHTSQQQPVQPGAQQARHVAEVELMELARSVDADSISLDRAWQSWHRLAERRVWAAEGHAGELPVSRS